jgi:hypothetical protein
MKKQLDALTANINSLLKEKTSRLENEYKRQFHDYLERGISKGSRSFQTRSIKMDFPHFDGDDPTNWP